MGCEIPLPAIDRNQPVADMRQKPASRVRATLWRLPAQFPKNTSAIILPSLIAQPEQEPEQKPEQKFEEILVETPSTANAELDIRAVTSNRVNVRGGPGTNFDIVGKLVRGAEVEILSDAGTGWVEMRSLDGQTIGWMADFLLSDG